MRCLGITKKRRRCKNDCKIIYCKTHRWQWLAIFPFLALVGGLLQDVVLPVQSILESEEDINEFKVAPFVESDSFKIILLPIETYGTLENGILEKVIIKSIEKENKIGILNMAIKYLIGYESNLSENKRIKLLNNLNADLIFWGKFENNQCKNKLSCIQYQYRIEENVVSEELSNTKEVESFINQIEKGFLTDDLVKDLYLLNGINASINLQHFSYADSCFTRLKELYEYPKDSMALNNLIEITIFNDVIDMTFGKILRKKGIIPEYTEIKHWEYIKKQREKEEQGKESIFD